MAQSPAPRPSSRPARRITLSEIDLELLRFLAEHRFLLADHAAALLGVTRQTASRRLGRLAAAGYVRQASGLKHQPDMHLITPAGLAAAGSTLPRPRVNTLTYEHDVGVAWLWLAARSGTFAPLSEILAERRLRSQDGARDPHAGVGDLPEPLGVRKGGVGAHGGERLHYPDLLLRTEDGRWVALELELSTKARTRLESILAAYAADPRIAGVVYLVQSQSVARSVERAARRVGVPDLVHIQRARLAAPASAGARGTEAERAGQAPGNAPPARRQTPPAPRHTLPAPPHTRAPRHHTPPTPRHALPGRDAPDAAR